MKFLFGTIVFISLFVAQTLHAQHSVSDLAGSWVSDDGTTGNIQFLDGKVQGTINGIDFPPTSYTVDFGRTPIWFDVAIMPGKTVQGLLEFIDDDTVKWQIILSGDRGYDFHESEGNPIIILKRKK